jgi:hypothetical protein
MPLSTTFQLYRGGQFFLSEFVSSEHNLFCQSFVVRTQFFCQSFVVRTQCFCQSFVVRTQFFCQSLCRQNTDFCQSLCRQNTVFFVSVCVVRTQFLYPAPRRGRGAYCFTSVRLSVLPSVRPSVLPSVRSSFRPSKIFFVAFFSVTDIWSQASYMYTILWVAFLDPSDSYFLFADLVGLYTH